MIFPSGGEEITIEVINARGVVLLESENHLINLTI